MDPPFEVSQERLADTDGHPVTLGPDADSRQLRLVFFGYTHCPDICPTVLGSIAVGLKRLSTDDRAHVQVYFVTTDPARDTAGVLDRYLDRFDPSFRGLRTSVQATAKIGRSVGIYVDEGDRERGGGYDPNSHSTYAVAIGTDGRAPAFWDEETSPSEFAGDIRFLLHGQG